MNRTLIRMTLAGAVVFGTVLISSGQALKPPVIVAKPGSPPVKPKFISPGDNAIVSFRICLFESGDLNGEQPATNVVSQHYTLRIIGTDTRFVNGSVELVGINAKRVETEKQSPTLVVKKLTGPNKATCFEIRASVIASSPGIKFIDLFISVQYRQAGKTLSKSEMVRATLYVRGVEFVFDDNNDLRVDDTDLGTPFVRFGIWDQAYTTVKPPTVPDIRNGFAEKDNFVGSDARRFYFRVVDPTANKNANVAEAVNIDWYTLKIDGKPDNKPKDSSLILTETGPNKGIFVSRAVMLVSNRTDLDVLTNTGQDSHPGNPGSGVANHRTRIAHLDGTVVAQYPTLGKQFGSTATIFNRTSAQSFQGSRDERRRLPVRVVNYLKSATEGYATDEYIQSQFAIAQLMWTQVGLKIDPSDVILRKVAKGMLNADGEYDPDLGNQTDPLQEAAVKDLIKISPDNTLTVAFLPLKGRDGYAALRPLKIDMGNRFFIFMGVDLNLKNQTLGHELFHALYNRGDGENKAQFFTFNTHPPSSYVNNDFSKLPNSRIFRRIHPFSIGWFKVKRKVRYATPDDYIPGINGFGPALTPSTGNTLVKPF